MYVCMETFPEEELHTLLVEIKKIKSERHKLKKENTKLEKEYNLKYNFVAWKKLEGKYFLVKGFKNELFYCHVIEVNENKKKYEYIDMSEETYSVEEITDPKEEPGYKSWTEVGKDEYEKEKEHKKHLK